MMMRLIKIFVLLPCVVWGLAGCGGDTNVTPLGSQAANIAVTDPVAPVDDHLLPFGSVQQGASSDQTLTVTNTGTASLVIGTVASANMLAAPFSITANTCSGQTIAPAGSCSITIRFSPTAVNSFNDGFDMPSNDPDTPTVTISISGTGTAIPVPNISVTDSVNPDSDLQVPFGDAVQGSTSDQTVTVTNTGTASLVIGTIASANPLAAPFSITANTCSDQTIAPAGSCTIAIQFAPSAVNSFNDGFDIPSDDPDTPTVTISVSGTSTAALVPNINVTDSVTPNNNLQVPFGSVTQGSTAEQTVTITNTGTASLVIGTVASANPLAAPFSITANTCSGQTIAPAGTCSLTIRFAPSSVNSFTDDFDIPSNDPDTVTVTISVNGTGTAASVPNLSVTDSVAPNDDFQVPFGNLTQGSTSDQTVTIKNTGTTSLVIGTIASANPLAPPFSITANTCSGQTIAPAGTCSLTIRFAPSTMNSFNDAFDVPSDDPDTPTVTIGVSGIGANGAGEIKMGGAIQGNQLALANTVTTFAGLSLIGWADGTGTAAKFHYPTSVATDGVNLYVADANNSTIRKIVIATGTVSTLAGSPGSLGITDGTGSAARFYGPRGITCDGTNLYVADTNSHTIRKIVISTGVVTTLAGSALSMGSTDGTGSAAGFYYPEGIATDGSSIYVADTNNNTIRKIDIATASVTTLAGLAGWNGIADGTGSAARFNKPYGITVTGGNLYVTDTDNQTIRKIVISTAVVTTLAGSAGSAGTIDGTGTTARFRYPWDITTDGINLYVADTSNHTIRKIVIATGNVTTMAGTAGTFGDVDGTGTAAMFYFPYGITTDGINVYVADAYNHTIRQIEITSGIVTSIAGAVGSPGTADGVSTAARFNYPYGVTSDGTNLYVADSDNHTIRKIVISTGAVTTLAGSPGSTGTANGTGSSARFHSPHGITTDGTNLYVTERYNSAIRKIVISTGAVTTLAGSTTLIGSTDGIGTAARFRMPDGITTDGTNLYVADTWNHTIRKVEIATATVTTLAGTAVLSGTTDGTGSAARFNMPSGITTDGTNLYVSDSYNNRIRKIVISTGAVTTFTGSGVGYIDGTGAAAKFQLPYGITMDGTNLYVADSSNHKIRKINISSAAVTTICGLSMATGSADGTGTAARFYSPHGITTDGVSLYVTDSGNNSIRKIE